MKGIQEFFVLFFQLFSKYEIVLKFKTHLKETLSLLWKTSITCYKLKAILK